MNSTLRDAALFGHLIRNRGSINGKQIIAANWVDETLRLTTADKARYSKNDVYVKGKYAVGVLQEFLVDSRRNKGRVYRCCIHGQVVYINRSANGVMAYFSSQPIASSSVGVYKAFVSKAQRGPWRRE